MLNHKNIFFSVLVFALLLCFSSCKMKAEQKSLTSQFDTIDALISQNQMDAAIKMLKKIEKKAHDSWSCIGIYKRYSTLGEKALAEKILKKSLKKNSQNIELLAVYSNFLIKDERFSEAENYAKKLCGTKYASIYSELILKEAQKSENQQNVAFYNDEHFYQIYLDAYNSTKNPVWLKNCAVFDVTKGFYEKASLLNPKVYADVDDAFFWAQILYDARKYYAALDAIEKSKNFLNDYKNKNSFRTTFVQQVALESDVYMALSDMKNAEKIRQSLIFNIDNLKIRKSDEKYLPIIFVNSAIWAKNQGNDDKCADFLFYAVNNWPDYVPALVLYADFAYNSNKQRSEDSETAALRQAGLSSLEMQKYDNRRKIPISDAVYRINQALERKREPYLEIVKLDLRYKTDSSLSEKEKNRDLWYLLEDNYVAGKTYNVLLVQYALNYLLRTNQKDDAWQVFFDYVTKNEVFGKFDEKKDFWQQFIEKMNLFDVSICEFAGYFAAEKNLVNEAIRIYEYCVFESSGLLEDGLISQKVSVAACMNLADIYFSTGKKDKALQLYGIISGRENKNSVRSEIFYRIANIYVAQNDVKNALRLSEYSYSLYPQNVKASVLKDKLHIFEVEH